MTDIDILKQEDKIFTELWRNREHDSLDHMHVCDFELLNFLYCKNTKKLNKIVKHKCKKYLSSIGKKRDKCMSCCDHCIHERYVTISRDNPGLILNICSILNSPSDESWYGKNYEKLAKGDEFSC